MAKELPVRKYVRVWIKKRKNNSKQDGSRTTSYTLEWVLYGRRHFLSLGKGASLAFARTAAARKEKEINSPDHVEHLKPVTWDEFVKSYLDTTYPGHDLPLAERKEAEKKWAKSIKTMKREKLAMDHFARIIKPHWCHDVSGADRERFVNQRLEEAGSGLTVDAELRSLRMLCNIMEEWKHRSENSNPFAGRGKATVGARRKRQKERQQDARPEYYTVEQIRVLLQQADKEVKEDPTFARLRLRALVYFVAYTGCRINEALHLEWQDIDWEKGIAWLYFKAEHDLKTEGSAAPFGLPDALIVVLQEWEAHKTCNWVFANSEKKPWVSGGPGYRPFDQLKELASRAGVERANWKMFRHSFDTHGKGKYGMTREQMQAQLRHTTPDTQKHYDHADLQNLRDAVRNIDFRK